MKITEGVSMVLFVIALVWQTFNWLDEDGDIIVIFCRCPPLYRLKFQWDSWWNARIWRRTHLSYLYRRYWLDWHNSWPSFIRWPSSGSWVLIMLWHENVGLFFIFNQAMYVRTHFTPNILCYFPHGSGMVVGANGTSVCPVLFRLYLWTISLTHNLALVPMPPLCVLYPSYRTCDPLRVLGNVPLRFYHLNPCSRSIPSQYGGVIFNCLSFRQQQSASYKQRRHWCCIWKPGTRLGHPSDYKSKH